MTSHEISHGKYINNEGIRGGSMYISEKSRLRRLPMARAERAIGFLKGAKDWEAILIPGFPQVILLINRLVPGVGLPIFSEILSERRTTGRIKCGEEWFSVLCGCGSCIGNDRERLTGAMEVICRKKGIKTMVTRHHFGLSGVKNIEVVDFFHRMWMEDDYARWNFGGGIREFKLTKKIQQFRGIVEL